jgi:membrane protein implicated in regulation of membrane protease activity
MQLTSWHWLIAGGVLMVAEALAPGFVLFWLGLGAAITGVLLLLLPPIDWTWQVLLFAFLAVALLGGWLLWRRRHPAHVEEHVNLGARRHVGAVSQLVGPLVNGRGRIKLGDSVWSVAGPDLAAGTRVRVVGADGTVLRVEPDEPSAG